MAATRKIIARKRNQPSMNGKASKAKSVSAATQRSGIGNINNQRNVAKKAAWRINLDNGGGEAVAWLSCKAA